MFHFISIPRTQMWLFAALLLISLSHCTQESPEAKKARHRERAVAYFDQGQYQEALIEFKNVVQIDPKDADGHYRLALAYLKVGGVPNLENAFQELTTTVSLNASNYDAHLRLGQLHLMANQPEKALEQAESILASAPEHKEGHILLGQSLIGNKRIKEGIIELKKSLELNPGNMQIALDLARAYVQANNFQAAEAVLQQTLQSSPNVAEVRIALGDLRIIQGAPDLAEPEYKKALELNPSNEGLYYKLAGYYQSRNRVADAEATFAQWAKTKPDDEKPVIALGDMYRATGKLDQALTAYTRALEVNPASILARDTVIAAYIDQNRLDEADHRVKTILAENPKDPGGRFFDGRLKLARGAAADAISVFREVLKDLPQSAPGHHYLGIAYAITGDLEHATAELIEAKKLTPQASETRGILAKVYLRKGIIDLAIDEGLAALQSNPRNIDAALVLGEAYLRRGDHAKSKQVYDTLLKIIPNDPTVHHALGLLARAEKKDAEAIEHFEQALAASPRFFEPLDQIASILAAQGRSQQARDRVAGQLKAAPDNPLAHVLIGRLFMAEKDVPNAEASFKKAVQGKDAPMAAYTGLAELYARTGKLDQAVQELESAVNTAPGNIQALMMLGLMLEARNQPEKATIRYEEALKINPRFAPAANNLAWYLIENGGNPEQALAYAKTAREVWPQDPTIADTLGWIYYRTESYPKAVTLLKEAAEKFPDNPVVLYHYGMALAKAGNKGEAKKVLQKSLKISPIYQGSEIAKVTLGTL